MNLLSITQTIVAYTKAEDHIDTEVVNKIICMQA